MKKKGVFFSSDALIAIIFVSIILLLIYPLLENNIRTSDLPSDVLKALSQQKIGEVNNSYVKSLILNKEITNLNNSILEQIGEFYVKNITKAKLLATETLSGLDSGENIGIWFGNNLIYIKNSSSFDLARVIEGDSQIISGIQAGGNLTGFSAKAYLSKIAFASYFYFGGYVGDGNLSLNLTKEGTIQELILEVAINNEFDVYINNLFCGHYENSSFDFTPQRYDLTAYLDRLNNGSNLLELRGNNLHVAGGFFKVLYNDSVIYSKPQYQYLPGIDGLVNLYDGVSFPDNITSIEGKIHFNSNNRTIFMSLGNITLLNQSSESETIIFLNDTYLKSKLNYSQLEGNTLPLRLGLLSYIQGQGGKADVVLITDTSGSMAWRVDSDVTGTSRTNCSDPLVFSSGATQRLSVVKCLDKDFVSTVLQQGGNRMSLISFSDQANSYVNLTSNETILNTTIYSYSAVGGTCIACAINRAYEILNAQSNSSRKKFIVVMSDGVANYRATPSCGDLSGSDTANASMIFSSGINGIFAEKNSSLFWNIFKEDGTNTLNDLDFYNDTLGFSVGNNGVIYSWNNSNWNLVSSPTTQSLYGLDMYDSNFGLAVGNAGTVLKWNGTNWSSLTNITNSPTLYGVSIYNSTLIYASGYRNYYGRIYKSTDGGNTWTENYSSSTYSERLYDVEVLSATSGFAVGTNGRIVSLGSNQIWSTMTSPTGQELYEVENISGKLFIAGGDAGSSIILYKPASSWIINYSATGSVSALKDISGFDNVLFAVGEDAMVAEYSNGVWSRTFNVSFGYMGNLTTGISCNDDDTCSQSDTFSTLNAKYSSCRAKNDTNVNATVFSIGFGPITTCNLANATLYGIAACGNGSYYSSTNSTQLQEFYIKIANDIVNISFTEQTSLVIGNFSSRLYPDSYILINSSANQVPYGFITTTETKFSNSTNGIFFKPSNAEILDAKVISYSGQRWTSLIKLNNNVTYSLGNYGINFNALGDPYSINLKSNFISNGNNTIDLFTSSNYNNFTFGSSDNKVIITTIRNISMLSGITSKAEGCLWYLLFASGKNLSINIPSDYSGSNICYYGVNNLIFYDTNDALQVGAYQLFSNIDFDNDKKIDVNFDEQDLKINSFTVSGIPYTWSTPVQVRTWY